MSLKEAQSERSVGITISKNQDEFVKEMIEELGLKGRVDVYLMHYEDLPRLGEKFNKKEDTEGFLRWKVKGWRAISVAYHRKGASFKPKQVDKEVHISWWLPTFYRKSTKSL